MDTRLRKRFGDRVRALRQASGLSQEAFADHCGFARSYMSRIERGRGNPSLDAIEVLAIALKVNEHELFITGNPNSQHDPAQVLVPYAADGSCFHPGLVMTRSGRYHVGTEGTEQTFTNFTEALACLREMSVACWRRPNKAGNWTVVKAVRWAPLEH